MSRILLLEDDLSLVNGLSFALNTARTLREADAAWADGSYDLLVLDVSLPDGSGFAFCEKVRRTSNVPIMFLTASDEETNIIMGLDMGGDDYITKPFKLGVLLSRINALLRRANAFCAEDTELQSNGIRVLLLQGQAFKNGELLALTAAEYKLLCLILRFVVKGEWVDMPLFAVSASGILSGAVAGVVTVFIAAHSPARQAARVSPAAVVSGNADTAAHYAAQTADRVLQVSDGCLTDFGRCQEKPVPDDRFLCADDRAVSGVFGLSGYRAQVSALGEQPSHAGFFPSTAWMTPIPSTPPWLTKLRLCPA